MLLLANAPRSTKDIDIFWFDEDGLQRAYAPLRESVQVITQKHDLDGDWFNFLAQLLMYDEVIVLMAHCGNALGLCMSMPQPASLSLHSKSPQAAKRP